MFINNQHKIEQTINGLEFHQKFRWQHDADSALEIFRQFVAKKMSDLESF